MKPIKVEVIFNLTKVGIIIIFNCSFLKPTIFFQEVFREKDSMYDDALYSDGHRNRL